MKTYLAIFLMVSISATMSFMRNSFLEYILEKASPVDLMSFFISAIPLLTSARKGERTSATALEMADARYVHSSEKLDAQLEYWTLLNLMKDLSVSPVLI